METSNIKKIEETETKISILEKLVNTLDLEITDSKVRINDLIISGMIESAESDLADTRLGRIMRSYRKELKQYRADTGDALKKLKEVNPSRKHYFLRLMDGSRFYIFGSLRQWCKENDFGLESLRNYENTGIIEKSSIKDHSFNSPKKAKLLGGEFFSYTQLEFSNLEITLLNNIKNEFDIKD